MQTFSLSAPAKMNHFLHITGRRDDGYHELQTLFQYLDFCDELIFSLQNNNEIVVEMSDLQQRDCGVPLAENLVYKVASFLQKTYHIGSGIHIKVNKKIPMGAGLGGGSSNAATTLLALNYVWELNLSLEVLLSIAGQFGADIPFFILGQSAWGEGIGTKLTKTQLSETYVLVLTPPCWVSTVKMYQHPQLTRNTSAFRIDTLEGLLKYGNFEHAVKNDFEPLVSGLYPEVAEQLAWLNQYARARLSGSGASLFALFKHKEQADSILQQAPESFKGFVAKSLNHSPLHTQLGNLGFFV